MVLTALPDVQNYMRQIGLKDETSNLLDLLISAVDGRVKQATNRTVFTTTTVTEYHDGDGETGWFYMREGGHNDIPINSVTSLHDDTDQPPTYGSDTLKSATEDYVWYPNGKVQLYSGGVFNEGLKNIRIIYEAGNSAVPDLLKYAATKWVVLAFKEKDRLGVSSISGPDGSISIFRESMDTEIKRILRGYWVPVDGS